MADGGVFEDRQQFWRDHVAGWKSSGLSLRLYSERHGLKAARWAPGTPGSKRGPLMLQHPRPDRRRRFWRSMLRNRR